MRGFDVLPSVAFAGFLWWILALVTAAVHVAFALGVAADASRLRTEGREPRFVPPVFWGLAALLGGVLTALFYWAIHHSTFAPGRADRPVEPPPAT